MLLFLYNTLLGFIIGQAQDILTRNKDSKTTPEKINLVFFLKDTWQKILVSLTFSLGLSTLLYLNGWDLDFISEQWRVWPMIEYAIIGYAPELFFQLLKKRYGFLQPDREKFFKVDSDTEKED